VLLFHEVFYSEETDFRTVFFESKEEFEDAFYEREAKKLYNNFTDIMKVYQNAIFELTCFVITDINEDEEAMLDYLLDEFGKETSSTPETDRKYFTEEEIKAENKDAANEDKRVLNLMKADKWEEISHRQRLKLWTLIEKLIDQTDDTYDPVAKYERINKYLRKYTVEAVEISLTEIELKLKFPELYKIFKYLKKLNDLYGNIENAEAIRSSVEPKVLIDTAKKLKEIFKGHEAFYLDYMYHSQESSGYTLEDEINYAGKIDKCKKIKESENDGK
jgi:hypothetical protein